MFRLSNDKDYNNRRIFFCYLIFAVVVIFIFGQGFVLANNVTNLRMYCGKSQASACAGDYDKYDTLDVYVGDTVYFCARADHGTNPQHVDLDWGWNFKCGHDDDDSSGCGCPSGLLHENSYHTYSTSEAGEYYPRIRVDAEDYADFRSRDENVHVRVVEVDEMHYDDPTTGYTNITSTLYVRKGTTVTFKAVKYPVGLWPSDKPVWGGSAGATGTGYTTKYVYFNTVSSSSTDYKTVTAECGNTKTVNVIVYEITADDADCTNPTAAEINYTLTPSGITVNHVDFSAPGTTDNNNSVSGTFDFTYDQDDVSWGENTIRLEDIWGIVVDCTVTKTAMMPDNTSTLTVTFLGGVGLKFFPHTIRESYYPLEYSIAIASTGKTVITGNSIVIMDFNAEIDNMAGWTESHKYEWSTGDSGFAVMTVSDEGWLPSDERAFVCNTVMWCIPTSLKGIGDCTGLLYDTGTGTVAGIIVNSEVEVEMPEAEEE